MDAARDPFEELTDLFLSDDPAVDVPADDVSPGSTPPCGSAWISIAT